MRTKFRKFLAYLLVLMLICSDLAVPVFAEELAAPGVATEPAEPALGGTLTLPAALKIIEEEAFCGNTSIGRVVVPEGTTTIQSRAFADSSLTEIVLPQSLSSIADDAFSGCGEFTVSAAKGSYAYDWAVGKGYIIPSAFTTEVLADGTLAITGYTGADGDIVIPAEIDGVPVTRIAESAFSENEVITSVVVPDSVTAIGASAFFCCRNLTSVELPDSITVLETSTFSDCFNLASLRLPAGLTSLGDYSLSFCQSLSELTLPDTIEYIGEQTLCFTTSLKELRLPANLKTLGYEAFYGSAIESITLPGSLTSIADEAFIGCRSLKSITIEEGVTSLSHSMFFECSSLTEVHLPESLTSIAASFERCTSLTYIVIPKNVSSIAEGAFADCPNLTVGVYAGSYAEEYCVTYNIPHEVIAYVTPAGDFTTQTLDDGTLAITGYSGYDSDIVIPAQINGVQVTKIGERVFQDNSRITSVVIPEGVTSIGKAAFSWTQSMTSIQLPSTLKTIGASAFNCSGLTSVTLPEGLTSIGDNAFNSNRGLTQITLPASLTDIGSHPFWQCTNLRSFSVAAGSPAYQAIDGVLFTADGTRLVAYPVGSGSDSYTVPAGVTVIGNASFRGSRLTSVTLPEGVTAIENWAFGDGANLTTVDLPASLSSIGDYAFNSCRKMAAFNVAAGNSVYESIDGVLFSKADNTLLFYPMASSRTAYTVPDGTRAIADDAFSDSSLASVTLPESLESIGDHAFVNNFALTGIHIPANVSSIKTGAFRACRSMTGITVSADNAAYKSVDGVLFSKDGTVLHSYPSGKTASSYTVPDGVLEIAELAFIENEALTSVTLPEGLTTISNASFNMCYNLESINIPESVTFIDTFYSCDVLVATVVEGSYGEQWCDENGVAYDVEGETDFIESEHPYPNDADQYWEYTHPEEAFALALTFSSSTQFENNWDVLTIIGAEGSENRYSGSSLAGKTVAVPGNSFTLHLTSDESVNMYGFRITKIEALTEEEYEDFIGFQTELLDNGTLSITGYNGPETNLEIPSEIDGTPVTAISEGAFRSSSLNSIVIPEGVAYIGRYAFSCCADLTDVTLPQSLRVIDNRAFEECESLVSIVLPDGLTSLGSGAFEWCYNLESVNIPSGLTIIPASAFIGCCELRELVIPEGIKTIEEYAFSECSQLTSVSLPASLTSIGSNAFRYVDRMIVTAPEGSYAWQWAYDNNYLDIAVIESDHPYEAGILKTWEYTAQKENVYALAVSFSRKTNLEYEDNLTIIDAEGVETAYSHSELAGETVVLNGSSFSLRLDSLNGGQYGFAVTKIEELTEEDYLDYGGFTYEEWDYNTICLTGYTGLLADLEIPAEIDGYSVAAIGYECFINNPRLISVVIPEGVTDISEIAFAECENLTSVSLPSTLTYIGESAFRECRSLTAIDLPEGLLTLRYSAFDQCDSLTEITIPGSLTKISEDAFYGCDELTSVTVSEGVKTISNWAFGDCPKLETVNLPASVTSIGEDALAESYMATIYAPEGSYAWQWADENGYLPETALIESAHPYAPDSDLTWEYASENGDIYAHLVSFSRKTCFASGDQLIVTDADGNGTTYSYSSLRNKTICVPGSSFSLRLVSNEANEEFGFMVTEIVPLTEEEFLNYGEFTYYTQDDGTLAVSGYTGFNPNLTIPAEIDGTAVTTIANSAFYNKDKLESIVISEGITSIEGYAFYSCDSLASVTLPASLKQVGYYAFANCSALPSLILPEGLTETGSCSFAWCGSLTEVTIPSTLTSIGAQSFYGDSSLTELTISEGVTSIGNLAFSHCFALTQINLPSTLISIGASAFSDCDSLTEITIPEGVTELDGAAFQSCDRLERANLPASLTSIQENTFSGLSSSFTIYAPEGSYAYNWAAEHNMLYEVALIESEHPYAPDSELSWEHAAGKENTYAMLVTFSRKTYFNDGDYLTVADAEGNRKDYWWDALRSKTIVIMGDSFTLTLHSNSNSEDYGFMVTKIIELTEEEFLNYGEFTYNTLDDGTVAITGYTGYQSALTIPSEIGGMQVTAIRNSAFRDKDWLESVVIPEGVTNIDSCAFQNCDNLSSVVLPDSLRVIGVAAFEHCNALETITIPEGVTTIDNYAFNGSGLTEIIIPEGVTKIGDHTFVNCDRLTSVSLPEGLTKIGPYAFAWCYHLADVNLPSTLTSISEYAFYHCNNSLTEITIPEGVTEIGEHTFANCHALQTANLHSGLTFIDDSAFLNDSRLTIYAPEGSYAYTWAEGMGLLPEVAIIESAHPYAPNSDETWTYTADNEDIYAQLVTFSRKTTFSADDHLVVTDGSGSGTYYYGSELAGRTLCLFGNSFTLRLYSNDYDEAFGFMVTEIAELTEEEFNSYGEFTYNTLDDGTLSITGYTGFIPNLVIPAEIGGIAVTAIGSDAFFNNDYVQTLVISEGIKTIGNNAFGSCNSLTSLVIPSSVTTIEANAFWNCHVLPELTIPEGVTAIGSSAFSSCYGLQTVNLPASLTSIGEYAFNDISNFEVNAPEGSYAYTWAEERGLLPEVALIESEHPYAPDSELSWEYIAGKENTYAMLVTFSRKTYFADGDYLRIAGAEGTQQDYWWDALRSKTIVIMGDSFTLTLHSNSYSEDYGFMVTEIIELTEEEFLNYGEFTYNTLDDGTVAITGYTGYQSALTIPSEIDGMQVTAISHTAFGDKDHLESVVIPEGVTTIYSCAFQSCDNLSSVVLPDSLRVIDAAAFEHCNALETITIPEGVTTIGNSAFNNSGLTEITLPDSVTTIGNSAFIYCYSLRSATLSGNLSAVTSHAFYNCSQLTEVTVPEGVTSIEPWAFGDCHNLETVNLPASLTFIDEFAFANDSKISIYAPEGSYAYTWAEGMDLLPEVAIIESAHPYAPNTDETWTHTVDSEEIYAHLVTFSRNTAFSSDDYLVVTDGKGSGTYYYWSDLAGRTLCLPGNSFTLRLYSNDYNEAFGFMVTEIVPLTEEEFLNYGEFTYNMLDDGTVAINGYTGFNPNLVIPAEIDGLQVTVIENDAFSSRHNLETVVISEGITSIHYGAFRYCPNLTSVVLPETLTTISTEAFRNCTSLAEINFPGSLTTIMDYAFAECHALTGLALPEGLAEIDHYSFAWCYGLTEVTIPSSLAVIDTHAFYACNALTEITIPEGVTSIENYAFGDCSALTRVSLSESLTFVDNNAFGHTGQAFVVTAPEGSYAWQWAYDNNYLFLTDIETEHPYAANTNQTWEFVSDKEDTHAIIISFARGSYLESNDYLKITDADGNEAYYYYSELNNRTIIVYSDAVTLNFVSDAYYEAHGFTVTRIEALTYDEFINHGRYSVSLREDGTYALNGYTGFSTDLVLPSEIDGIPVTAVVGGAFQGNQLMTSVVIPDSITHIGDSAFQSCTKLTSVTLPAGLTRIEAYTFNGCSALTEITIPDSVDSIGYYAFGSCDALESVSLPASLTYSEAEAFGNSENIRITAPEGSYAWQWAYDRNYLFLSGIESEHPIAAQSAQTWEYTHPSDAYALKITFSRNTEYNGGAILTLTDAAGTSLQYSDYELANTSVFVQGNSFTLSLTTDVYSGGTYGFAVTKIEAMTEEEFNSYGGFSYYENGDGTISISGYSGLVSDLILPSEIDGMPVTRISGYAFQTNRRLTGVTIPEGVTSIEEAAFENCPNLTRLSLPSTLSLIGYAAFEDCVRLADLTLPDCLTTLDSYAFNNCDSLTEVVIPAGVSVIGEHTFNGCDKLTSVTLSDGAQTIGVGMFQGCSSLTEVVIPASITHIGESAFLNCDSLSEITVSGTQATIDSHALNNCDNLTTVVVNEGVTAIGYWAFGDCYSLTSVTLPASLERIDDSAFGNSSAVGIIAPEGSYAYVWASERSMLKEESVLESEHPYADNEDMTWEYAAEEDVAVMLVTFSQKTSFESGYDYLTITDSTGYSIEYTGGELAGQTLTLPGNTFSLRLTSDGSNTHFGFRITKIEALTEEEYASHASFTTADLGDGTLAITDYFGGVSELEIPAEIDGKPVVCIGEEVFFGNSALTSVIIPEGVTTLSLSAFNSCSNLTSVSLPGTLATIGSSAFANCTSLTGITIPGSVSMVYGWTFYNCTALTEVTFGEGVYSIEEYTFDSCPALTRLNLPASLESLSDSSFLSNPGFTITAPAGSYAYDWAVSNSVLYEEAVIESAHPYASNEDTTWEYTAQNPDAYAIMLTFSAQSYLEGGYDYLTITDGSGAEVSYTDVELAGRALPVMGSSLTLRLTSDGGGEYFGFRILRIEELTEEEYLNYAHYDTALQDDGTLAITGYSGFRSEIVIPSEIDGLPVTAIGSRAFRNNQSLTRVTVPSSVTSIGEYAFEYCGQLTGVTLPESLTSLGSYAFTNCTLLESIEIPGTVSAIGSGAFSNCAALTSAVIGEGATTIGNGAFNYCYQLSELSLPFSINRIDENAFSYCTSLSEVSLNGDLQTLGAYAFYGCSNLTGVTLQSAASIGDYAFAECVSLSSIDLPDGLTLIGSSAFQSCSALSSITLPATLQSIGSGAFCYCSSLTGVELPDSLTFIGSSAFQSCSGLTEITIPGSIAVVDNYTFNECYALEEVTVSEGTDALRYCAFTDCPALVTVNLPASLTEIDENAFSSNSGMDIIAPEGSYAYSWAEEHHYLPETAVLESAHPYAPNADELFTYTHDSEVYALAITFSPRTSFEEGCDYLTLINADGIGQMGGTSFAGQTIGLLGSSFSLNLTSDGSNEHFGFRITKIEALTEEEYRSYGEFTHETLSDGTLEITGYTGFLKDLELPSEIDGIAVTRVADRAFDCTDLNSVVIPEGVTSIGENAFYSCQSLTSVTLPDSLQEIGMYAFYFCTHLTEINLPDGLTAIGSSAFNSCEGLKSVTLPDSLTQLGDDVFRNCISLTSVSIPGSLPYISCGMFMNCSALTDVTIAEGSIDFIDCETFRNCTSLKTITIPEGVTGLLDIAFDNCPALTDVYLPASLTTIDENAFGNSPNVRIIAPEGSYAEEWAVMHDYVPEAIILQSAHPYANAASETWEYTHPEEAYALAVTFSSRTLFEDGCDHLTVTDGTSTPTTTSYTGSSLSGQTILLMGNSFSLNLTTDGSVTRYGFSIVRIEALTEEEYLNYGA